MLTKKSVAPRGLLWTAMGFLAFFVAFFSPVIFGKLMASGDGLVESVPAFLGPHRLWEPALLLGYPLFADPNQQYFYPLAWMRLIPQTYNAFAMAPFVLASIGTAGLVHAMTKSMYAGIVAGLVYSLGGFMISHAGHLMLSHPAAWAPFVLWGIESMRRRPGGVPIVATAVALGLCGLSGQPQLFVFTATLAALYALVSASGTATPRGFLLRAATALLLGLAFAGTQFIPEALLAADSTRASLTFDAFTSFELPVDQLAMRIIFPYLLGTTNLPWYAFGRFDLGTFTEETITVGLVSLALAVLALRYLGLDRRVAFWYAIAFGALVLAVGDATPVAKITYRLPVFGLFRAPGRHAFEFTVAIAVLAGYGCASLFRGRANSRHVALAVALVSVLAASAYAQLLTGSTPVLRQIAATYGVTEGRILSPVANGAVGIPLATGFFGLALLYVAGRLSGSRAAPAFVMLAIAFDLGVFGWSAYWHWGAATERDLQAPAWVTSLGVRARSSHTRIAWLPGTLGSGMPPNLTSLWNVPVVGGYSPLVPQRTEDLLSVTAAGGTTAPGLNDAGLDLAGASVVATNAEENVPVTAVQPFASTDLHAFLGPPQKTQASRAAFGLPAPFAATRVALVSELGNAPPIVNNAQVAELDVLDVAGHGERYAIVAGRDTSEFAYDRADVLPLVRHRRAQVYSGDATTHRYLAYFKIATHLPIRRVDVRWTYGSPTIGALTIEKLSLVNDRRGTAAAFGNLAAFYAAPDHWKIIPVDPTITAFENRRAMPQAWFGLPIASDRTAALEAIRGAFFPDGSRFDARRQVTTETLPGNFLAPDVTDRVQIEEDRPAHQTLTTTCAKACFLVVRDAFDPQWRVWIDERPGTIVPADIGLRGVAVPAGTHRVRFAFIPTSLYVGIAATTVAAIASVILVFGSLPLGERWRAKRGRRGSELVRGAAAP